ncbi:FUSC family protein [Subtercola sp. YIM 133946]|uniref:FUSC family protein n=1 Tax=Subtercola sp. YIM 133946 TaxID=3118909 RepID=UPI002F92BDFA
MSTPAKAPPLRRTTLRFVVAVAALFVPAVVVAFTPLAALTELLFIGLIPTLFGALYGRRVALTAAVATAVTVGLVELVNPYTAAAVILMAVLGFAVGLCGLRGWQSMATIVFSWPAVLVVGAPVVLSTNGWSPGTVATLAWLLDGAGAVLLAAVATLVGGLWTLIATLVLPPLPRSTPEPLDAPTSLIYGGALALVLAIATSAASTWAHGTMAGWALLTILVVARPGIHETWHRVVARALGTIAGGVAAGALSLIVPVEAVLSVLGLVALVAAVVLQLKKANYALYSIALTAAIVLLNAHGVDVFAVDVARVLFTIAGAVLAAAAVAALQIALAARTRRQRDRGVLGVPQRTQAET